MTVIWQKDDTEIDAEISRFLAGSDVELDAELFGFDIEATNAHVRGLERIGIFQKKEADAVCSSLSDLDDAYHKGTFRLDDRFEDGHSAIEIWVTDALGDLGKRIHTGRSRNDQVQVALRLHMDRTLARLEERCAHIATACLERAEADAMTPMPGYTHLQRAMPSSVGLWLGGFCEAFLDDRDHAAITADFVDQSPLGTGAGFGVSLPLDRDGVALQLGFARLQRNPQYVQNARGKFELLVLGSLAQALLDVRRLAWDLSLFTMAELAFVKLPPAYTTGSSLMPNKRNPDVVELLRASAARVIAAQTEIAGVLSLPSGYQRDLQATKRPYIEAAREGLAALALVPRLVGALELDRDRMRAAISDDMYATDRVLAAETTGVPFRDAYRAAAKGGGEAWTPEQSLSARISAGACGDLGLAHLRARLDGTKAADR
ncbi:argininosuccinate lyase [soil metagenome]